jgi:general stress protein CsbA
LHAISENHTISKIASWRETVAGILPVLTLSLATTLEGTSTERWYAMLLVYIFIFLLYALPAIGTPIAVKRGIPRWSSSYLGLLLFDLMLLPILFSARMGTASGGVWIFGMAVIVLLIGGFLVGKNLLREHAGTEKRGENDWSQILFSIQTLVPIYLLIRFDEIDVAYKSPYLILGGLILAAGAVVYLRARQRWLGLAALLGSVLLVVLLAKPIVNTYWSTHPWG